MSPEKKEKSNFFDSAKNEVKSRQQKLAQEDFVHCVMVGDIDRVKNFLDTGINLNQQDEFGNTPLIQAAKYGRREVVQLLIAHGADVTAHNRSGWTALQYASYNNRPDIEELLRKVRAKE